MRRSPTTRSPIRADGGAMAAAVMSAVMAAAMSAMTAAAMVAVAGCSPIAPVPLARSAPAAAPAPLPVPLPPPASALDAALRREVSTIVVIYAENRAFDNLFGRFPGARGLGDVLDADGRPTAAYVPQKDRDGRTVLAALPPSWGGVTMPGVRPVVTQAQSAGLPNAPFPIETAFQKSAGATLGVDTVARDLIHRFFENQMQIAGGRNDGFAAWSNVGGLALGTFDYSGSALWKLARENVLADHFFQGAFGGSFLNHQYLICACAPVYPQADLAQRRPSIAVLERDPQGRPLPRLALAPSHPVSAMDGGPVYVLTGNLAPADYFGDGLLHAINTMQPPYQPSGNPPADATTPQHAAYATAASDTTLPAQTAATIGDLLDARGVDWAWYAGSWNAALADGMRKPGATRTVIYADSRGLATPQRVDFQPEGDQRCLWG